MTDSDPFAPRHIGAALSLTGLVALMTGEGARPEILGLACGCLAASLVAFAVDLCHTPKPRRSRKARPPLKTRRPAAVTAQWNAAPARSALPDGPPLHPALSALVRATPPAATAPAAPAPTALHRRALKEVRNRRIARGA
ncbi:hypothetical protein [Methylobacterium sp. J-068]|uniref:hypothetical protein n=1 Tax=Methylobacterium sp. J-068 TaxID=2836649 RepID=UPI001FBB9AFA|nr:hypothetical protein [Methylobacterium sp. J-068]MCJ2035859.1 hypothetical protein [Methylobacterium sp. J-068]